MAKSKIKIPKRFLPMYGSGGKVEPIYTTPKYTPSDNTSTPLNKGQQLKEKPNLKKSPEVSVDEYMKILGLASDAAQFTGAGAVPGYVAGLIPTTYDMAKDLKNGDYKQASLDALGYIPTFKLMKYSKYAKSGDKGVNVAKKLNNAVNVANTANDINQYKNGGKLEMKKQNYIKKYAMGGDIVSGVGNSLDTLGQFIPTDNDGHGVSKKGQAISTGIQSGLGAAADVAGNFGPMGKMVSGALKIGQFLTKGFTAIADAVKEKKHPTDELVNETYSPTYKDSSMSFGNLNTLNQMALGGQTQSTTDNFKQYEAPSHENGGQMIDANNNPTKQPQKAVAEIEKKENSYKNYVFSHELGFAKLAEKINKKYKDREDPISKNSLDTELTELMKKNEKVKQQIQQSQQLAQAVLEYGGNIPKMSKGGFNDYPSWLSDIPQYEYQSGAADGTGLSNYGFNKNIDGTPATAPKSLQEATIRVGEQYLPLVKDYPSFIQPQLLDYIYNSGRSIKDLLLYSQGKISLADINSKNNYDKDYDTKYKSDIEKAMLDNPEEFYKKLVQARHDVAKTTKGYSLDNPNPAYEKTWKNRIDNFKYGDEQGGKGIAVSSKNNKAKLPYEKGYVNQLMENAPDNNGVSVPVPNVDFLKGIALSDNIIEKDEEVKRINNLKDILENNFNLKEVPEPPNNGEGDLPKTEKKQFSPEAISGFGIKGIEMLGHAIQAFKKPDYVKPAYNPEENAIKGTMANRKIDAQSILDAINLEENAGKQNLANNSSSVGVQNANMQKLHANAINSIAKTKIEEQQLNNQYRGEEANMLNTLGTQKMQAQVYAEDVNAKSKANVQMQRDKFLKESIGGLGDYLLKKDYVNKDNEFQMNILKSKGINFEATDYKDWNKAGVDIAKFTGELESETDTAKRKAKMEEVHQKFLAKGGTEEAWQSNSIAQGLTNKYLK
jgi:hypothetical protein